MTQEKMDLHRHECIRLCWECRDTCQDTLFNHVLEHGGEPVDADFMRVMTDCMAICQAAADSMRRDSRLHFAFCAACAEICHACADACESLVKRYATMQHCVDACRRCADSCRAMSQEREAA